LEQVNKQAINLKANYFIVGYYGIKGPKGDNQELSKGIDYLLSETRIPTILIKDTPLRSVKEGKGYKWLFVFDKQYHNVFRVFKTFHKLIDVEKDYVYGLTLLPINSDGKNKFDDVKEDFMEEMTKMNIKNFDYETVSYSKLPSSIINDKINFGTINFDFLVFYNNTEKYKNERKSSDMTNIISKSNCSICFFNY
jgi:hypothetical protein